jgi:hypothetical protein
MDNLSSNREMQDDSDEAEKRLRGLVRKFNREVERDLQKDRRKLLAALEDFANIRPDRKAWSHFRRRWPKFFPASEFDRAERGLAESVRDYPKWLDRIWRGYESGAPLLALLGLSVEAWKPVEEIPRAAQIHRIPAQFLADWDEGTFQYRGLCHFQRALFLLFRESWRARVCEKCGYKFVARRVAQRYCSRECSESMQKENKRKWWNEHGEEWRKQRMKSKRRKAGGKNVTHKTR